MTPANGYGHGYGMVGRADGDTGTIQRQTTAISSSASADPQPTSAFKATNLSHDDWVDCGNGTYKHTLILETDGQSCFAVTNPLLQGAPPEGGSGPGPSGARPGDGATGQTWQICNVTDLGAGQGVSG